MSSYEKEGDGDDMIRALGVEWLSLGLDRFHETECSFWKVHKAMVKVHPKFTWHC